jgi:hypothetical protein
MTMQTQTGANSRDEAKDKAQQTAQKAGEKIERSATESTAKLGEQTKEAVNQFAERDNAMQGWVGFWEKLPAHYYFWGASASVLLSLLLMLSGKQRASIFVGLWPTTIINAALLAKLVRPSNEV